MFSQSSETFLYGGPTVPFGYQSLSSTFSRATPRPTEHQLSPGNNRTKMLNTKQIFMEELIAHYEDTKSNRRVAKLNPLEGSST